MPGERDFGPWNPGIESPVSGDLLPLCTIFRPENVYTSFREARELRGLTGLELADLVAFRPERLALHELLIRVSADFSVPDGEKIEDLGINFRAITSDLLERVVGPRGAAIAERYAAVRNATAGLVTAELTPAFASSAGAARAGAQWADKAHSAAGALERCAYRALGKVVSAVLARHGRPWGTPELIASIAANLACNEHGADEIGRLMQPWIAEAARDGCYTLLPRQAQPVVMNTKGASASGKSTIRPLQRRLAGEIGTRWGEFALVSPDIWRKQLLDYGTLGAAYKYAGAFTGDELAIVDQKLDRYIASKAERGEITHLLIDRFRFDSFAPDSDVAGSNLLTRFGRIVYLFFMITPPEALVERAWRRGLEVGRYKAVDDTLAHGVEAYSGMPQLFFTWIERSDKRVHFEFLDNTVALGEPPRTVAFGWNEVITVLDVKCMLDVVRYRRVDTNATSPQALFPDRGALAPEKNTAFLRECVQRFREVNFGDAATGRVYLHLRAGKVAWVDRERLQRAATDADTRAGLAAAGALDAAGSTSEPPPHVRDLAPEHGHTVGQWATLSAA